MKSIALKIQEFAKATPDQVALIINDDKCSYKELAEINRKAALYLQYLPNCSDAPFLFYNVPTSVSF